MLRSATLRSDRAAAPPRTAVWRTDGPQLLNAFIVTPDVLVSAGQAGAEPGKEELVARSMDDGAVRWRHRLPASPVKAGLAIDSQRRIVVALVDGSILCFTGTPQ